MNQTQLSQEPGTLIWVGPRAHPEFKDAFQFCVANSAQVAMRNHLQELSARPAGFVKRILIVRQDRRPAAACLFDSIMPHYRNAEFLTLSSSLCDGEMRTGNPWTGLKNLRFSRWQEKLPEWLGPCGYESKPAPVDSSVLVLSDRYETAEPLLDYASALGQMAIWKRSVDAASVRNVSHVIWDESVAKPAGASTWRARLARMASPTTRHGWLVTQVQSDEIQQAMLGGVSIVYTKPMTMKAVFHH